MWNARAIADIAIRSLQSQAQRAAIEQAWQGIDALGELELHPILARGFFEAGWGVLREQPYPGKASSRARSRDRERCDLVLMESPGLTLADPVAARLEQDRVDETLFAGVLGASNQAAGSVKPERACWVEVKSVGRFACCDGVPGPNGRYTSELVACRADLVKLARDPCISWGMLLIVLMGDDAGLCEHDLLAVGHACVDLGIEIGVPAIESIAIADHIGNTVCSVGVFPSRARSSVWAREASISLPWDADRPS